MNTILVIVVLAIVVIAFVLLVSKLLGKLFRSKGSKKSLSRSGGADASTTRWRSVKIAPGLICCDQAAKTADQVFLSSESPTLPLEGCTAKQCSCRYIHLDDRRSGGDRRIELGDLGAFLPVNQVERRRITGRRAADLAA